MPASMFILTWVGIIFVKNVHLAFARCKIMTNIMPTHAKISIEPSIRELFLKHAQLLELRAVYRGNNLLLLDINK
jgi:hypothetical protein